MTRRFNQRMQCPCCKAEVTIETALGRWLRAHPDLKSEDGMNIYDADCSVERRIVHRNKFGKDRYVQCFMEVEVKEYGAQPSRAQAGTFQLLSDYIKNYRGNIHTKRGAVNGDKTGGYTRLKDRYFNKEVIVRHYGYHLLQFEKTSPEDSEWIKWDNQTITPDQLVQLLRFEIHPYTFNEISARDRHVMKEILLDELPLLDIK